MEAKLQNLSVDIIPNTNFYPDVSDQVKFEKDSDLRYVGDYS
jgi:hypothetical protein